MSRRNLGLKLIILAVLVAIVRPPSLAVDPAKPSFTATFVLAFRALGTKIPDAGMRNPDLLAPRFLGSRERELLLDVRARLQGTPRDKPLFTDLDFNLAANLLRDQDPDLFARFLYVLARTRHMDACLRQALDAGARQVVVLGAGYDSRAYRTKHPSRPRFFEADFPATQEYKKMKVRELFGSLPQHVVFVPIDFEKGSLAAALRNSGYRKPRRSREMTHFCSDRVTHTKNTVCPRATGEDGDIIRAEGVRFAVPSSAPKARKALTAWEDSRVPRKQACWPRSAPDSTCPRARPDSLAVRPCSPIRGAGALLASKVGSFLASAEADHPQVWFPHVRTDELDLRRHLRIPVQVGH